MSTDRRIALTEDQLDARLADLHGRLLSAVQTTIGFPAATDFDVAVLAPFLDFMLNNLNDPELDGLYPLQTKELETEAWSIVADLLGAPIGDRWGYVTSGATEGNEHGLHLARVMYPTGVVYVSAAAHPTIGNIVDRLRVDSIVVRAEPSGEVDYADLAVQVDRHRHRPAIVVACIGTPLTEALDDVARIDGVLDDRAVCRRWIHADAALSGIPLALLDPEQRPAFDFTAGTRSIVISGHKFLGSPVPYAVFLIRDSDRPYPGRAATYTRALCLLQRHAAVLEQPMDHRRGPTQHVNSRNIC